MNKQPSAQPLRHVSAVDPHACQHGHAHGPSQNCAPTLDAYVADQEQRSKDDLFVQLALTAQAMISAHGKEFAMGALILSARFIAEGRPLLKPANGRQEKTNSSETQSRLNETRPR